MKTAKLVVFSIELNEIVEIEVNFTKAIDNKEFREKVIKHFRDILNKLLEEKS